MKNICSLLILTIFLFSCKENKQAPEIITIDNTVTPKKELLSNAVYDKAEFTIKGMTCQIGCAATIEKKLAKMKGVKTAKVDFEKELAIVEYDTNTVNVDDITETVTSAASGDVYTIENIKLASNNGDDL